MKKAILAILLLHLVVGIIGWRPRTGERSTRCKGRYERCRKGYVCKQEKLCFAPPCPKECVPISGCKRGNKVYAVGENFPAGDGCNTCSCRPNGQAICTLIACPQVCEYNCKTYAVGQSFPSIDGCNTCRCLLGGSVGCTKKGCPPTCRHNCQTYFVGQTFPSDDGCNECTCTRSGTVACTEKACVHTCEYNGQTYSAGETFPAIDGCNECSCSTQGTVSCSGGKICGTFCDYMGKRYSPGEMFTSPDGCNKCSCTSTGMVICTLRACPPPPSLVCPDTSGIVTACVVTANNCGSDKECRPGSLCCSYGCNRKCLAGVPP